MKCSWLLALASLWSQVQAQSDLVLHWVNADGEPVPASTSLGHTLHVGSWIDGISQSPVQGEDLVVDEEGWCQWPDVKPGVFLCDPANEYITGSTLTIDGGIQLPWRDMFRVDD